MSDIIRVLSSNDLNNLYNEYKCVSKDSKTSKIPVIINDKTVDTSTEAGDDDKLFFKSSIENKYVATDLYDRLSIVFAVYLPSGKYEFIVGAGNTAFISFLPYKLSNSIYTVPSNVYYMNIFVDAGFTFNVNMKKDNGTAVTPFYYILKCESIESEDIIYENFYTQVLEDCANRNDTLSSLCVRINNLGTLLDPRYYLTRVLRNNNSTVGEWKELENTCSATCDTGYRKSVKYTTTYLDGNVIEDTPEYKQIDCLNTCPKDGYFSDWSAWSTCSKTCGSGTTSRTRTYTPAVNGGVDLADRNVLSESKTCNTQSCVIPYKIVLAANKSSSVSISLTSPNGVYKFEWLKTPTLSVYLKQSNGSWGLSSSITVANSNNKSVLSLADTDLIIYNSTYTSSTIIARSAFRPLAGLAINDSGQLVLITESNVVGHYLVVPGRHLSA